MFKGYKSDLKPSFDNIFKKYTEQRADFTVNTHSLV